MRIPTFHLAVVALSILLTIYVEFYVSPKTYSMARVITDCWVDNALLDTPIKFDDSRRQNMELDRHSIISNAGISMSEIRDRMRKALYDVLLETLTIYRHREKFYWKKIEGNDGSTSYELESYASPYERIWHGVRLTLGSDNFISGPVLTKAIEKAGLGNAILPMEFSFNVDPYSGYVESNINCPLPLHKNDSESIFYDFMRRMTPPCPGKLSIYGYLNGMNRIKEQVKGLEKAQPEGYRIMIKKLNKKKEAIFTESFCNNFWQAESEDEIAYTAYNLV